MNPRKFFFFLAVSLPLFGGAILAQRTLVLPEGFEKVEGRAGTGLPFGLSLPIRMQAIYQPWVIENTAKTITQIDIRADWSDQKGADTIKAKAFVHLQLFLSHSPRSFDNLSKTFAKNRGDDDTVVIADKRLALPAQPKLAKGPRPFNITLKLDKPFVYLQTKGPLLVEISIKAQPKGDYRLDSPLFPTSPAGDFGKAGPACTISSTGKPLVLTNGPSFQSGGSVAWKISGAPPEVPAMIAMGTHEPPGLAFGKTTPFHLGPFGAKDCYVNTNWVLAKAFKTTKQGSGGWVFPLPKRQDLWNQWIFAQAVTSDLRANPMGLVLSKGRKVQILGPIRTARVFAINDLKAKTGILQKGSAPIIALRYR